MGFSRQEYWSGLSCPLPWDLPNPGIEPKSLTSPTLAGGFFTISATWDILAKGIFLGCKLEGKGLEQTPKVITFCPLLLALQLGLEPLTAMLRQLSHVAVRRDSREGS